ncbi:MAG: hypothetical protein HW421_65 [Ignavibacteria bacterium]|nr:hypothetical protein [Ignavibacteria bacterium]
MKNLIIVNLSRQILIFFCLLISINSISYSSNQDIVWLKQGCGGSIAKLRAAPSGKFIVFSTSLNVLSLFDTDSNKIVKMLDSTYVSGVYAFIFSEDSKTLATAVCSDSITTLKVWDLKNLKILNNITFPIGNLRQVDISPDFSHIACKDDNSALSVWDTVTGNKMSGFLKYADNFYYSLSYNRDGKILSLISAENLLIVNALTGDSVNSITGINYWTNKSVFSPDNSKLIKYSTDDMVYVYSTTGFNLLTAINTRRRVTDVAFTTDSKRIITSTNSDILVWDINSGDSLGIFQIIPSPSTLDFTYINQLPFLITGRENLKIIDFMDGTIVNTFFEDNSNMRFSSDGSKVISRTSDRVIRFFDTPTGIISGTTSFGQQDMVSFLPWSDYIYILRRNQNFFLVNIFTGDTVETYDLKFRSTAFSLSPNRQYAQILDSLQQVQIWDWKDKKLLYILDSMQTMQFSPQSKYMSGYLKNPSNLQVLRLENGKTVFQVPDSNVIYHTYTYDEKICIVTKDNTLKIYEIESGNLYRQFTPLSQNRTYFRILPAKVSKYLVETIRDGSIQVHNISTGAIEKVFFDYHSAIADASGARIAGCDVSPDFKYIVAGYPDGTGILWRIGITVGVDDNNEVKDSPYCTPNPCSNILKINLPSNDLTYVDIDLYGLNGIHFASIFKGIPNPREHSYEFDTRHLPEGTYFCRIISNNKIKWILVCILR